MADHYMNPFHFVPLPPDGPVSVPEDALKGPRLEGYLEYSLTVRTPLHITGKTTRKDRHFKKKCFYERHGAKIISGSAIRGMISSFVEALTGSDLRVFTRGDEKDRSGRPAYGKWFDRGNAQKCRHVGFLITSSDPGVLLKLKSESYTYTYRGKTETRTLYERNKTLPPGFGRNMVEDAGRFLFGYVHQEDANHQNASAGRLIFEDLIIPDDASTVIKHAWDLDADSVMGSPNPRANTAWYFTPGNYRERKVYGGPRVWEVLAEKVRGRKFYFHQHPEKCHEGYRVWENWMPLVEYDVETIDASCTIPSGRVYFTDLPEPMLKILLYSLMLDQDMAHKLGALKPFGFGSVKFEVNGVFYRRMEKPLEPIQSQELTVDFVEGLIDNRAFSFLKKIMHFPEEIEKADYVFMYPPFRPGRGVSDEEKGFACVETVDNPKIKPEPGSSKKTTLFFNEYQRSANNHRAVMG